MRPGLHRAMFRSPTRISPPNLQARFRLRWQSAAASGLTLYHDPASSRDVLLVDRFSDGHKFPPKGGVGHARKTGADLAAYLIHQRRVCSPWIHCTDADVRLPRRYFTCSTALSDTAAQDTAALVYPFRHSIAEHKPGDETPDSHRHKSCRPPGCMSILCVITSPG